MTMVLRNQGGAGVDLDLAAAATRLQLNLLNGGGNVTGEYTIVQPAALFSAGTTVLAGGATDSLRFNVTQAGVSTGSVIVSGFAVGTDLNSQQTVTANTAGGGTGSFVLQSPGGLSILSMTPAKTTATVGQTSPYKVRMAVRNTGGANVALALHPDSTMLQPQGLGWVWTVASTLAGGGRTLSPAETDTVTFTVTTTGGSAGLATIGGSVMGVEANTLALKTDDTASGGAGSITLQTPAVFNVVSVTPSRATVTQNTPVGWDVTVVVQNTGGSSARVVLPSNLSTTVQSSPATLFNNATSLLEGLDIVPAGATRTNEVHANNTGAFSAFGSRSIDVTVPAVELNSNRAFNTPGTGAIIAQKAPVLAIVGGVTPNPVTRGVQAAFSIDVSNSDPDAATVALNRGTTRAHFASNAFSAFLSPASFDVIPGGSTVTLTFEAKPVDTLIAAATYDFNTNLAFTANSVAATQTPSVTGGIVVQAAPQLLITGISTSQNEATAGQTQDWFATMSVMNNGEAPIRMNFASN
jgi:hypothetical protein